MIAALQPRPVGPGLQDRAPEAGACRYTPAEELANWLTHGAGAVLSVAAVAVLMMVALEHGDAWHLTSFAVYGVSLVGLYTASTCYHLARSERRRALLRRLDHAAIFLLIAGTYTPFVLTTLRGPWGWSLFGAIWTICGVGAFLKCNGAVRHEIGSTLTYLLAGWLIMAAANPLFTALAPPALWLLLAGGFFYTTGVAFYLWHSLRFHHAIWHGFVLCGSACHFVAVLLLLGPPSG